MENMATMFSADTVRAFSCLPRCSRLNLTLVGGTFSQAVRIFIGLALGPSDSSSLSDLCHPVSAPSIVHGLFAISGRCGAH